MKFSSPELVSETIWRMRLADLPRGTNRGLINSLVNGDPPYTEKERQENNIEINVNFLDATQLIADARRSLFNAFQQPGKFFTVTLDYGPLYKRVEWGRIITRELNKIMKSSRLYAECLDAQFAAMILHGKGPAIYPTQYAWCPEEKGVEDVLIPGGTLRSFRNLDHFAAFYRYTPAQLYRLTHGSQRDKRWNMDLVDGAMEWAHNQTQSQLQYAELFAPEKVQERYHEDLGFYGTDAVPTIDCWKFFFYEDKKGEAGWRMGMVLDTPGAHEIGNYASLPKMPRKNLIGVEQGRWLFNPGDRPYAESIEQIVHFQHGDLSAVSPFRYHSERGLGWLLYAICHLQNRLLGKYNEAVFENLLQYFRGNEQDRTRTQKVDLHHYGWIPDGVSFVRPEERWQVNHELVGQAIDRNRSRMEYSAAQYRQQQEMGPTKEKTATQVMAEINSAMSMVGSLFSQAYRYQTYGFTENARRFCLKDSRDPEVKLFRSRVLKQRVPPEALNVCYWNVEPERVMGGGNKTLQVAMAESLLAMRPFLDPESQRIVDRINIAAKTDNDDLANRLVPEIRTIPAASHDAANSFGTLMAGGKVPLLNGINHPDAIEALITNLGAKIQQIKQRGGLATMEEILGLRNVSMHIAEHMQALGQDKAAQTKLRQYSKVLSGMMNDVKAMLQQLVKAQKDQAAQMNGGNGMDPKTMAKIQGDLMMAKVKSENAAKSHAEKTAQRQLSFEQEMRQKQEQHALEMDALAKKHHVDMAQLMQGHGLEMRQKALTTRADVAAKDLQTAAEIRRGNLVAPEPEGGESE